MPKQKISKADAQRRARSAAAARGTSFEQEYSAVESSFDVTSYLDYYSSSDDCGTNTTDTFADSTDPGCS